MPSTENNDTRKYAQLPLISVLSKKEMATAKEALEELDAIQMLVAVHKEREAELKLELETIQRTNKLEGFRLEDLCYVAHDMEGRRTLDTTKLIELAGITPEQIKECSKVGKPFVTRTFKNLSRKPPKSEKSEDE